MTDLLYEIEPLTNHIMANAVVYGLAAIAAAILIFLTRPYSTAILFYSIEITIYLVVMHTVIHIVVRLTAWFSNETTFRNIHDGQSLGVAEWTTPWLRFWELEIYDPWWLVWFEAVLVVIIIALVRYYRPMKVQRKLKTRVAPAPKKSKKKGEAAEEDDDWGVATTRRFTLPDDLVENITKKKK